MSQKLKYVVVNSQIVCVDHPMTLPGGEVINAQYKRTALEARPEDALGKTFSAMLPAECAEMYPEGSTITITVEAEEATDSEDTEA